MKFVSCIAFSFETCDEYISNVDGRQGYGCFNLRSILYTNAMTADRDKPRGSGIVAVGVYLRALRESAGLSVAEVSEKVGMVPAQIWRVERGYSDTKGSTLFLLISLVGGDPADVAMLINNPAVTPADGETLARLRRAISR
jgi:hypothetical protein